MQVTIEGTITPSTHLATGARRTVERTPFIDKLIRGGFVAIVDEVAPVVEERKPLPKRSRAKKAEVIIKEVLEALPELTEDNG